MEDHDYEFIERYYRNALNKKELSEFQRRLAGDVEFQEAVQLHQDALEAIRQEGVLMLRARLTAKGRELDIGMVNSSNRVLLWAIGLLVVLLVACAIWWWTPSKNSPAPVQVIESRDIATPAASDTTPGSPLLDNQSKLKKKIPERQRVFATWFQPYKDPSLEPARRGNAVQSPSEHFQQLYWDENYQAALGAFDSLSTSAKNNDNLLFLKANCLLAIGEAETASVVLQNLLHNDRSRFKAQLGWYLALSHLQTGRIKEAEILLHQIAADTLSPRRTDAESLLRELQ